MSSFFDLKMFLVISSFILTIIERDDGEKKQTLEN